MDNGTLEYKIAYGETMSDLTTKVNNLLDNEWHLSGNLVVSKVPDYYQALVKAK